MIVVAGGEAPNADALAGLPADAFVVAADSGADGAHAIGLRVGLAIGDFDSASEGAAERVEAAGGRVERYPAAKDATDLELALDAALARRPGRIVVLGGAGGRFDHWLAVAFLLASPLYAGVAIQARWAEATVTVVRSSGTTLTGRPGDVLTLLPVHGPALGVRAEGVEWPLHDEDLAPGTTRGVSNVLTRTTARVSTREGVLLAVQPSERGQPVSPRTE
ncbi:thiamine diphosphokinase [Cryptosporangium arvum]|uniref:Thiamine diphosphokinase n=1 Tax=Cryptosporangium arvum DSM 44712 TaxID=927661 RepID=A0A010ZQG0_9ACTN|nr:thiamine diphosphokinase [Cryptosporangium arvum]EXG80914.1 thiamine pyrophosphokinase [Cryptosporangium arvum DSM 44712]